MMDGFLLTLWCVPTMTLGHLQLAVLMTTYILVGVHMEERGLLRRLGEDYRLYCQDTPMLIPVPLRWRFWRTNVGKPWPRQWSSMTESSLLLWLHAPLPPARSPAAGPPTIAAAVSAAARPRSGRGWPTARTRRSRRPDVGTRRCQPLKPRGGDVVRQIAEGAFQRRQFRSQVSKQLVPPASAATLPSTLSRCSASERIDRFDVQRRDAWRCGVHVELQRRFRAGHRERLACELIIPRADAPATPGSRRWPAAGVSAPAAIRRGSSAATSRRIGRSPTRPRGRRGIDVQLDRHGHHAADAGRQVDADLEHRIDSATHVRQRDLGLSGTNGSLNPKPSCTIKNASAADNTPTRPHRHDPRIGPGMGGKPVAKPSAACTVKNASAEL